MVRGTNALANAGSDHISVHPPWEKPHEVHEHAGHGGGYARMLSVLFGLRAGEDVDKGDAAMQKAGVHDRSTALSVELAANESLKRARFRSLGWMYEMLEGVFH